VIVIATLVPKTSHPLSEEQKGAVETRTPFLVSVSEINVLPP